MENKSIPKAVIRQRGCDEDWSKMPFISKHIWRAGIHGEATGNCKICGKPLKVWQDECIKRALKQ